MKSIRMKLIFWMCILFALIGGLIYLPLSNILPKMVISQILKRDVEIAKYVSNEAKNLLLLKDDIALSILLHENLDRLEDAQYLFIQGPDENIISHTFSKGFPRGLFSFGLNPQKPYRVREFLSGGKRIYDIAVPILKGEIGTLHLGVSMEADKKEIAAIAKINYYVAGVILMGLGVGILVFLTIGFLFSSRVIKLKNFAANVGKGNLEGKIDIDSKDEIGDLASAFNEMASRLKEKIQEIKKLNIIEERNRIAFDLHDACAQDLANIIKRIELCEKLFIINPQGALEELSSLRESTKDILNRTRKVIFDLKSPRDSDFKLVDEISNYINNYKKQSDANIKLDISGSINNISHDKSKSIFYIMTEALANVRKHSEAKNVSLSLKANGNLVINIKDDGRGFDINNTQLFGPGLGKLGLISMNERAQSLGGTFKVTSAPKQGTCISVEIPLRGERLTKYDT